MILQTIRIALRARFRPPPFSRAFPVGGSRTISYSIPPQHPINSLSSNHARENSALKETENVKPGHAVISTFDLFSIGGESYIGFVNEMLNSILGLFSGPKQLTHRWPNACWQDFHSGPEGVRHVGEGTHFRSESQTRSNNHVLTG